MIQLSAKNIENILQKSLPYFFALVFVTTVVGSIPGYLEHNSWQMGDWLINYQGGMVRRGFLGEIIYQLSSFTYIKPGVYVVVFQIFFYAVFFLFSYVLLKKQRVLLPYVILIFSPFIFTFQINNSGGGFRKEIIYFALLAFLVWIAKEKDQKAFEKIFYIILILYPAVILTHEMLFIYLPFLLVVYLSVIALNKKRVLLIFLLLIPSIVSFLATLYYSGTSAQVIEIFKSIEKVNYPITGGAISWLDKDTSYGIAQVIQSINEKNYLYYIFLVFIAALAYIPINSRLKSITKNRLSLFLILISIIGSSGLFVVAIDWGRFIYISLVSIFLLSLIPTQDIDEPQRGEYSQPVNILIAIFFSIYTLFWYIPCCGSPKNALATNYKQVNLIAFVKPYKRIVAHYLPEIRKRFQ